MSRVSYTHQQAHEISKPSLRLVSIADCADCRLSRPEPLILSSSQLIPMVRGSHKKSGSLGSQGALHASGSERDTTPRTGSRTTRSTAAAQSNIQSNETKAIPKPIPTGPRAASSSGTGGNHQARGPVKPVHPRTTPASTSQFAKPTTSTAPLDVQNQAQGGPPLKKGNNDKGKGPATGIGPIVTQSTHESPESAPAATKKRTLRTSDENLAFRREERLDSGVSGAQIVGEHSRVEANSESNVIGASDNEAVNIRKSLGEMTCFFLFVS